MRPKDAGRRPVDVRRSLHSELRLDGQQLALQLRNVSALLLKLCILLLHHLMQALNCGERDTVGVHGANALLRLTEAERAWKSCAIGPMWRIDAS